MLKGSDADRFFSRLYVLGGAGAVRISFHVMLIFPFPTFRSDVEKHLKMQMNAGLGTATAESVTDRGRLVRRYRQKCSDEQAQREKSHKDK